MGKFRNKLDVPLKKKELPVSLQRILSDSLQVIPGSMGVWDKMGTLRQGQQWRSH